jgi:2-(1,2-epoxy-1,2-dihydrophenyl)acetyl-CoA isomerase
MAGATDGDILVEHRDGIAVVTLNRPDRRNGVTIAMCQRLHDRLHDIAASDTRVVVLHGAGEHFSVGADIDAPPIDRRGAPLLEAFGHAFDVATVLHSMPQVTIAAIDGACAGGGMAWAAACDFRFATHRATFSTAYLRIGIPGDMSLVWLLQKIVGGARAREMLFFPEKFGGEQAHQWGFVTRIHEPEALLGAALGAAGQLAGAAPFSLRMMKANLLSAETLSIEDYTRIETARMAAVASGGAVREGFANFKAKRS